MEEPPSPAETIEPPRNDPAPAPVVGDDVVEIGAEHLAAAAPFDSRVQFESGMTYWPALTLMLMASNVAIFIWELAVGALESEEALIAAGAMHRASVYAGEIWRLGTSMFLHAGFDHLIGNLMALYVLGMAGEHAFGSARTACIYLTSGLAGGLLSMWMNPAPTVGASGAIFGLLGCVVVFFWRYRNQLVVRDRRVGVVLAVWAGYQLVLGFLDPRIAAFAHLGGFAAGAALAALIPPTLILSPRPGAGP